MTTTRITETDAGYIIHLPLAQGGAYLVCSWEAVMYELTTRGLLAGAYLD